MAVLELFGFPDDVDFAHVDKLKVGHTHTIDGVINTPAEVEVHDAETVGEIVHGIEERGKEAVDAREGERLALVNAQVPMRGAHFSRFKVRPSHELHGRIEQELTLARTVADQQDGLSGMRSPEVHHVAFEGTEVHIAQNVDIVNQDGLVGTEERCRLLESAARFEQPAGLVGDGDVGAEVVMK